MAPARSPADAAPLTSQRWLPNSHWSPAAWRDGRQLTPQRIATRPADLDRADARGRWEAKRPCPVHQQRDEEQHR